MKEIMIVVAGIDGLLELLLKLLGICALIHYIWG